MDELTREFLIESQEGLDRMERCLTELEERPRRRGLLGEIFRSVHTIKGTTGFLGFKRLEKLAHAGENLLGLLREGKLAADAAHHYRPAAAARRPALHPQDHRSRRQRGRGQDAALIARLEELQSSGCRAGQASTCPCTPAAAKAARSAGRCSRARPRPPRMLAACASCRRALRLPAAAASPLDPARSRSDPRAYSRRSTAAAESTLRVDVTLLNRMMNLVGELVLTRNQVLAGHCRRSQYDDAFAPSRHGHRRFARVGDEGAHAAGLEHLLQDAAHCA